VLNYPSQLRGESTLALPFYEHTDERIRRASTVPPS